MSKKLTVIGRGTAGCYAVAHFHRWTDWEIDWVFDNKIKPQAVGEGSTLDFPIDLETNTGFNINDLESIYGTLKAGIYKKGWAHGDEFTHTFPSGNVGYHFNAVMLQEWLMKHFSCRSRVRMVEKNISHAEIDSDYIMDCSGKPNNYGDEYYNSECIPVNSVYVTQCFWSGVKFQYTLAIARPYGWVFGIPLLNRCSIGYMYNNNINTLDEVKNDVKQIFIDFDLTPSDQTNSFNFGNYYRKNNYNSRVAYNGNASFFLEPLEATSINLMNRNQRRAFDLWNGKKTELQVNIEFLTDIAEIENVIMLHYFAGSVFDTEFWKHAQQKGRTNFESLVKNNKFRQLMDGELDNTTSYGTWSRASFTQNLKNLGLVDYLN